MKIFTTFECGLCIARGWPCGEWWGVVRGVIWVEEGGGTLYGGEYGSRIYCGRIGVCVGGCRRCRFGVGFGGFRLREVAEVFFEAFSELGLTLSGVGRGVAMSATPLLEP